MKLPAHLRRGRDGTYYVRLVASSAMAPVESVRADSSGGIRPKRELAASLGTKSPQVARNLSRRLGSELTVLLQLFRKHGGDRAVYNGASVRQLLRQAVAAVRDAPGPATGSCVISTGDSGERLAPRRVYTQEEVDLLLEFSRRGLTAAHTQTALPGANSQGPVPAEYPQDGLQDQVRKHLRSADGAVRTEKSNFEYTAILDEFASWAGQRGLRQARDVSRANIRDYKTWLREDKKLRGGTVNKRLTVLTSFFKASQLVDEYPPGELPTSGMRIAKGLAAKEKRSYDAFDAQDVAKMFEPQRFRKWACQPDRFWPPLLMAHLGLRVGESCQILTTDIGVSGGLHTLHIRESIEGQHIKVDERQIPLHGRLIDLGFLEYVADVRALVGDGLLFPYLTCSLNGYADSSGEAINGYLKQIFDVSHKTRKRNHSFRHYVNDTLKQAGVAEEVRCQFIGHRYDSINSTVYGRKFSMAKLAELVFPHLVLPLDYESLRYRRGEFDRFVSRRLALRQRATQHGDAKQRRSERR